MRILLLSSEITPFAKTGGLADVAGAIPPAMAHRGHDIRLAMPLYQSVDRFKHRLLPLSRRINMDWGNERHTAELMRCSYPCQKNLPVYFVQQHQLFGRKGLYGEHHTDYLDNDLRFSFFALVCLYALKALDWCPDVIHLNDWQTGVVPVLLRHHPYICNDPFYKNIRTVFSIHNLAYQGLMHQDLVSRLQLPWSVYTAQGMEFYNKASMLKAGIVFSDHVTTVSPTYAREIQTEEHGGGLEGVLQARSNDLTGILNGIDTHVWNPEIDPLIPARFSTQDMTGKAVCRTALLEKLGLEPKPGKPLLAMISRLAEQKGINLLREVLPAFLKEGCAFALLGTGDKEAEKFFLELAREHPTLVSTNLVFSEQLAHEIEAGADLFLMPSRFEPCGLNQLYSMRYGTLPVVHQTGGLADSVVGYGSTNGRHAPKPTGFSFKPFTAEAFAGALQTAVQLYEKNPTLFRTLQQNAMQRDSSWAGAAIEYEDVYTKVMNHPRHAIAM